MAKFINVNDNRDSLIRPRSKKQFEDERFTDGCSRDRPHSSANSADAADDIRGEGAGALVKRNEQQRQPRPQELDDAEEPQERGRVAQGDG